MSHQDPVSDMLTRIRNAYMVYKENTLVPYSKFKLAILEVLLAEGYIASIEVHEDGAKKNIQVGLKYYAGKSVIEDLKRISKPSLRIYRRSDDIPAVASGLGIAILSTNQGLMTDYQARDKKLGGEVVCTVF